MYLVVIEASVMSLVCTPSEYTYKHRKYRGSRVPSWGDEGWTFTPLSGYLDSGKFQSPFSLELDDYGQPSPGRIRVSLPDLGNNLRVESLMIQLKSTLLMKGLQILETHSDHVLIADPNHVVQADYVGGIISIARFNRQNPTPDKRQELEVNLVYQIQSGNIYPMSALYHEGKPLQLDTNYLHLMKLYTVFEGQVLHVPTAWVDPGFTGVLYVPWGLGDTIANLQVDSYYYPGYNRYEGYTGNDRLIK